eukprot:gene10189-biopygen5537
MKDPCEQVAAKWRQSGGKAGGKVAAWRHGGKAGGKAWRHGGMTAWRQSGGKENLATPTTRISTGVLKAEFSYLKLVST